jgi:hypothetical protein
MLKKYKRFAPSRPRNVGGDQNSLGCQLIAECSSDYQSKDSIAQQKRYEKWLNSVKAVLV